MLCELVIHLMYMKGIRAIHILIVQHCRAIIYHIMTILLTRNWWNICSLPSTSRGAQVVQVVSALCSWFLLCCKGFFRVLVLSSLSKNQHTSGKTTNCKVSLVRDFVLISCWHAVLSQIFVKESNCSYFVVYVITSRTLSFVDIRRCGDGVVIKLKRSKITKERCTMQLE